MIFRQDDGWLTKKAISQVKWLGSALSIMDTNSAPAPTVLVHQDNLTEGHNWDVS